MKINFKFLKTNNKYKMILLNKIIIKNKII